MDQYNQKIEKHHSKWRVEYILKGNLARGCFEFQFYSYSSRKFFQVRKILSRSIDQRVISKFLFLRGPGKQVSERDYNQKPDG